MSGTLGSPVEPSNLGPTNPVLTQDIKTGALNYKPILVVHRNPPARTFRIGVGGEAVVSSEFHRFWKPGRGWVMALDLKPVAARGDVVPRDRFVNDLANAVDAGRKGH